MPGTQLDHINHNHTILLLRHDSIDAAVLTGEHYCTGLWLFGTNLLLRLQRMCWHHSVLRGLVLLWAGFCLTIAAFVFTLLVVFHTYLATTNQTTYEMMKSEFCSTQRLLSYTVCLDSTRKLHK